MNNGPDITRLSALIADPARAMMLTSLLDGRALSAGELAQVGGITPQTASTHLAKLVEGKLLIATKQGRHRYFRLAGPTIADLLENLITISSAQAAPMPRTGPRDAALRNARICYDHLAGEMGVAMFDGLVAQKILHVDVQLEHAELTAYGETALSEFGIDIEQLKLAPRPLCRTCLDWSVRRPHLAGALGASIWKAISERNWAKCVKNSRVIEFTPEGKRQFQRFIRAD
ncbi:MAG: winged helix-turn-helix domain-containing protein [Pseudomonadota bacterium]